MKSLGAFRSLPYWSGWETKGALCELDGATVPRGAERFTLVGREYMLRGYHLAALLLTVSSG